jgi:hypothetical protein
MAAREFRGAGGLLLHLDEPYSPQMEDQIRKGHLVPVGGGAVEAEEAESSAEPKGNGPEAAKKPNANSKVDDWRAYAVSLGMPEEEAADATKSDLQDWVKVADGDDGSGE